MLECINLLRNLLFRNIYSFLYTIVNYVNMINEHFLSDTIIVIILSLSFFLSCFLTNYKISHKSSLLFNSLILLCLKVKEDTQSGQENEWLCVKIDENKIYV